MKRLLHLILTNWGLFSFYFGQHQHHPRVPLQQTQPAQQKGEQNVGNLPPHTSSADMGHSNQQGMMDQM